LVNSRSILSSHGHLAGPQRPVVPVVADVPDRRTARGSPSARDRDRKGYLLREELGASPEAFKAANAKADGRPSLEEYLNALFKDFDAADTNRDGMLTYEELEVYIRTHRSLIPGGGRFTTPALEALCAACRCER
jgi:hypothetical protein